MGTLGHTLIAYVELCNVLLTSIATTVPSTLGHLHNLLRASNLPGVAMRYRHTSNGADRRESARCSTSFHIISSVALRSPPGVTLLASPPDRLSFHVHRILIGFYTRQSRLIRQFSERHALYKSSEKCQTLTVRRVARPAVQMIFFFTAHPCH